ncbi:MAG: Trm112 family protein [Blastocatellia bacterium]
MIKLDFLAILRCPACHGKLEERPDGHGLACISCRRVYPIRDEIPVLLIEEATIEEPKSETA